MQRRLLVAVIFAASLVRGQTAPARPSSEHVIGATTQEVMLDVVVRDKRGHMVKNLRADEVEVTDDGAVRKIRSFRPVGNGELSGNGDAESPSAASAPSAGPVAKTPTNVTREPRLITLVFDQLLPGQRPYARQAALEVLKHPGPDVLFAVFKIDQKLAIVQPYTSDMELVKTAIEKSTNPSYFLNIDEEDRIARHVASASIAQQLGVMKSASAGQFSDTDTRLAQMTLNMLQFADTGEQKEQSRAQLLGLWALVKEQKQLPGRKTLIYFSGGMNVPPEYSERFRQIVADANLANVTVYAINTAGITSYASNTSGLAILAQAAASSKTNMVDRTGIVSVDQAQVFDRVEQSVHANTRNALEVLTHDTGGFMSNSNDFRSPVHRISEEVNFHYELTYSPEIDKYDGHLRHIQVKVARPDVHVQTRSGYYALPSVEGQDLQPYEGPMLTALSRQPAVAGAIPFRAAAKWFGPKTSLVVDVPLDHVGLSSDEATGSFRMHMSVLALFKDSDGAIVQKVTRDVPAKGKLENLTATRAGHFIFTQHVNLPPGAYTLETAVFDREGLTIGTKKQQVVVPEHSPDLSISSLTLVRTVTPMQAIDAESPYEFTGAKVTPELNPAVKGGPGARVGVYMVVYGQKRQDAKLTINFLQDGKVVARSEPQIPAGGDDGHIPIVAQLPIDSLKPGAYEVLAKVFQDGHDAEQRIRIEIE